MWESDGAFGCYQPAELRRNRVKTVTHVLILHRHELFRVSVVSIVDCDLHGGAMAR